MTVITHVLQLRLSTPAIPNGYVLGHAEFKPEKGWRFLPMQCGRLPSRKWHETLEGCIPRWTGHPNSTASRWTLYGGVKTDVDFRADPPVAA